MSILTLFKASVSLEKKWGNSNSLATLERSKKFYTAKAKMNTCITDTIFNGNN